MPKKLKNLFIVLGVFIIIIILVFSQQIKRAKNIVVKTNDAPLVGSQGITLPVDPSDPTLGNPGAPLAVVMYLDLADSTSLNLLKQAIGFISKHPLEAKIIFKHAPLAAQIFTAGHYFAHQAAYCAGEQKQFWKFVEAMAEKNLWNEPALKQIAASLPLKKDIWLNCLNSDTAKQIIQQKTEAATSFGVATVPTVFLNNKYFNYSKEMDFAQTLTTLIQK